MSHVQDKIPYHLANGTSGTAMIWIIELPDGRKLVTCADENEDEDAAVNMVVEDLFASVCGRHRLDPKRVVWVEYTSEMLKTGGGPIGGWELVTFDTKTRKPSWRQMTREDWNELGAEPPPAPIPQRRGRIMR